MSKIISIFQQLLLIFTLLSICSTLSLKTQHEAASIAVQSNLSVSNWIYGTLTQADLKKSIFKQMTQNLNLLKCNVQYPFYNGQKCISCSGSTPVFNISTKQCQACNGQIVNHKCQ